jgi:hypothetical protein
MSRTSLAVLTFILAAVIGALSACYSRSREVPAAPRTDSSSLGEMVA